MICSLDIVVSQSLLITLHPIRGTLQLSFTRSFCPRFGGRRVKLLIPVRSSKVLRAFSISAATASQSGNADVSDIELHCDVWLAIS